MGRPLNTKEVIKEYIFNYIYLEFPYIKTYARFYDIKLIKMTRGNAPGYYLKDVNLYLLVIDRFIIQCFIIWMMMKRNFFLRNI